MNDFGFNIGSVRLKNPLILAPLAGVTNLPFRLAAKRQGAALTVTEMVSGMGLSMGGEKTRRLMATTPEEKPFCVQLFGKNPDALARGAEIAQEAGADIIDLNLGCPARKVVRHGSGAALLRDFPLVERILNKLRPACKTPLTVKTRIGWKPGEGEVTDLVPILRDNGVDAVTVHGRYAVERFGGSANWDQIARVVEKFPGPVIGNGDITRPAHVLTRLKESGCAGVMIGRGALGNPWIFSQTLDLLHGRPMEPVSLTERFSTAEHHARMLGRHVGEGKAVFMLRSVLMWYTKGLPESASFRQSINRERNFETLLAQLEEYFAGIDDEQTRKAAAL
jgi:tRNA-dihydrouridine synthase B